MHHPVNIENWSIRLALSIGVATYGADVRGLDKLIHCAAQHLRSSPSTPEAESGFDGIVRE